MPEIDVGTEIAGHRLEGVIGRGGMGIVYRALDLHLNRVVALKVIAPEYAQDTAFRERFKRESQQAASIRHPNVISIYRAGEEGDLLFITMDYVEGTDLKTFIGVRGRLDPMLAAGIISQVAAGLEAAHASGLVHRDVKPANVLIENQQQAYLTDFGLTKRAEPGSALTKTGLIVGTTDYLAPEQIQGDKLDARVDVYALGCVLHEALTGFVPYPRDTTAATMWAHMSDPPPSVLERAPDVPAEFEVVVHRAMAKDPNQRFISAEAMGRAITAAAAGGGRSGHGSVVLPDTAPQGSPVEPESGSDAEPPGEAAAEPPAPLAAAESRVTRESPRAAGEGARQMGFPGPSPAVTKATPKADVPARAPSSKRGNPRLFVVLGALFVALVAAAVVLFSGGGEDEQQASSTGAGSATAATELPADLEWQTLRDAPFRRQYAASTAVDGRVWVFGGVGVKTSSTTSKIYDPVADSWSTGPGLPLALHHFMAVTYKGDPVVIGGFVPGEELTSEQSDRVYVLRDGAWEPLPALNHPRAAAAAAVVGDKIVVVGGQANGKLVPQTEVFDGESWKDVAEIPTPREHLGAASDGRYLYAVGGRELSADQNSPALERYDPAKNRWTELEGMPEASGSVGAAYAGGRLVTVGGESSTSASDLVQAYNIQEQAWSELPKLPSARHGVAVTALKDSIYAIGGATAPGHVESTKTAEKLDLSGAPQAAPTTADVEWRAVRDAPFPRQYASATEVGGRVWLFGGIGEDETASAETAIYDRAINIWTKGPDLPEPLHHFMAVTYKGDPVVIGGFVPGEELTSEQSDRVYVLRDDAWEPLPALNHPRAAAAAAVVGDKIVVVGGQANDKLVPQTEVFDGESWKDVAEIPTPREHLGAASDGRYLYAVGGRELSADQNSPALERYDPAKNRWTELEGMPEASGSVGAAYAGGRLVTVGGESSTSASDVVQAYNIQEQAWSQLPKLPSARHGVAVTALRDSIYAIGGATTAGHVESSREAEVLDFD